ncbi:MAG: beta-lactamase family protein [Actinomycetota bacterium]|nr:beta-lactamase family protein [Actinomycetota bacterium]
MFSTLWSSRARTRPGKSRALLAILASLTLSAAGAVAAVGPAGAAPRQAQAIDVDRIDAFVAEQLDRHHIPGLALGIVEGQRVVHLRGFGEADSSGRAVTAQTPFVLASVSKPLTALAVMQLVEAGQVALDSPVQRYLPSFRVADREASARITVRELLNQTSGLPVTECETEVSTIADYVAGLRSVQLDREVGSSYEYCSGNYTILGAMIAEVSGMSYDAYMRQHVFAPLQMEHSFASEAPARDAGLAQGHQWLFGLQRANDYYNPSGVPSGYLVSSAEDMSHFLIAELNGGRYGSTRVLSPAGIALTQSPAVDTGDGFSYGMGWQVGTLSGIPAVYHPGAVYNFETLAFMEPGTDRGAVLLINAQGLLAIDAFRSIEGGVARLLAGQEPQATSLTVPQLYLIADAVLLLLSLLVVVPLARLPRWSRRRAERRHWAARAYSRVAAEVIVPVVLVAATWLVFRQLGARNWYEIISLVPDIVSWLLVMCGLLLLTGIIRGVLAIKVSKTARQPASPPRAMDSV